MTGNWKSTDELINMYSDLVTHANNGVLGFIDPLHPKVAYGGAELVYDLLMQIVFLGCCGMEEAYG